MTEDSPNEWMRRLAVLPSRFEDASPGRWAGVEFLPEVDSTNRYLLDHPALEPDRYHVCVAHRQTAGRGRRGRVWLAAPGHSLTFSLGRALRAGEIVAPAFTLAAGVGLVRGLIRCGIRGLQIKWPNDLVTASGAKLAGVLVELRDGGRTGSPAAVLGVGLNVSGAGALGLDRRVADLEDLVLAEDISSAELLSVVVPELVSAWEVFHSSGLMPFLPEYSGLDHLIGRCVRVVDSGQEGVAAGIDPLSGALLLDTSRGRIPVYSGDVSVRTLNLV